MENSYTSTFDWQAEYLKVFCRLRYLKPDLTNFQNVSTQKQNIAAQSQKSVCKIVTHILQTHTLPKYNQLCLQNNPFIFKNVLNVAKHSCEAEQRKKQRLKNNQSYLKTLTVQVMLKGYIWVQLAVSQL